MTDFEATCDCGSAFCGLELYCFVEDKHAAVQILNVNPCETPTVWLKKGALLSMIERLQVLAEEVE